MKITTCIFNSDNAKYNILSKVFLYSVKKHTKAEITVYHSGVSESYRQEIHERLGTSIGFRQLDFKPAGGVEVASQKMFLWNKIVERENENNFVIMDCDMLVTKNFDDVFQKDFDFAYTVKDFPSIFHINTGVVFIKDVDKAKIFFTEWSQKYNDIMSNNVERKKASDLYGAADQGSLYEIVGQMEPFTIKVISDIAVLALPSTIYNLHKQWEDFCDKTSIIHFKSDWVNVLTCCDSYQRAIEVNRWKWDGVLRWEPVYNVWEQYKTEYEAL